MLCSGKHWQGSKYLNLGCFQEKKQRNSLQLQLHIIISKELVTFFTKNQFLVIKINMPA